MMKKTLIASALLAGLASSVAFASEETDELRKVIAKQQEVLKSLEKRLDETEQRLEVTADQIENTASASPFAKTSIGGYGELHYNNYEDEDADVDFHRFVLFFGHEFTDKLRFFSEFELEHGLVKDTDDGSNGGEVELEQAFIEYDNSETLTTRAGVFLIPVGILNETHEPPTFYGVERNPVEKYIVPATWWEAGAGVTFKPSGGLAFDAAITSGLDTLDANIRSGRQKVSKANAENLAYTGRVKYTAIPGLELSATLQYQTDLTQSEGNGLDTADATLFETHVIYNVNNFSIRALYARWDVNGDEAKTSGKDEQTGFYVEPSYKFNEKIGVFARYAEYNNKAGDSATDAVEITSVGVNYYLHENVVFKADFEELGGSKDSKGFNLGVGYQF
jgi:hypothetical protein